MKIINGLFIVSLVLICQSVLAEDKGAFKPVETLFMAMSQVNHEKMKAVVTDDFVLLENGEVWTIDDLASVVGPSDYKRTNFFSLVNANYQDDIAWINYWNKANFSNGEQSEDIVWLESVVVVKNAGQWKLSQMHSTKLNPDNVPQDIQFKRLE
jgi:hypothetical protein